MKSRVQNEPVENVQTTHTHTHTHTHLITDFGVIQPINYSVVQVSLALLYLFN